MTRAFPPRQRRLAESERQSARTVDKAHGRVEVRRLISSTQLDETYLDFPGAAQCFQLTRTRTVRDRVTGRSNTSTEVVYGVTSLPREEADAGRLLAIVRGHWGIENKVFHVRDRTLGEDDCRVRKASAPVVLSTLRNCVLNILRLTRNRNRAAQIRTFNTHPVKALKALNTPIRHN